MKSIIKNLVKNMNKSMLFLSVCVILLVVSSEKAYALTAQQYDRFVEDGRLGNLNIEVNAKGQMFRKFGHFIIDGVYTGGDSQNPFYNEENSRDLAILAVTNDSVYDVYGEIDYDAIDYSYEDDETLNATEYDRATFEARVEKMDYGNTLKKATGYGKYNLRPGKNLTAFIKFAFDFYKNNSGEVRVGCKNADDLVAHGIDTDKICPMEELEAYASKNYISTDETDDVDLKRIWKDCTEKWEYQGSGLSNTENIFENLQDIFICYVYLKPGVDKIRNTIGLDTSELSESDYGAILSMMYERFGGRPINPARVESGNAIPVIGTGDVLPALVDLRETELSDFTIADKIYTCMIEVKNKNNDLKLAGWLKEAEEVNGGYVILTAKEYDIYMKAYQIAFQLYGQDTANDTLLDYGCVLTPDIFESKKSLNEALEDFARTIRNHFGNSSFYNNRDNANYVAKSYVMAKKICENSAFCDITDIYACDMDVVEHTYGYDSSNIILLADTQVVQLNDSYGEDCDTDQDGINDNVEAHTPEEVDITNFLKEYCRYNKYTPEETADMLAKNSKVVMYNYSSNPVLPDSDFDGRDDLRDGRKLDNEYNSTNETDNYSGIKIKFNQDYRYFFMESTQYYEELAEMGLVLSNMASMKTIGSYASPKKWINNNSSEHYTANNLNDYMWYLGMEHIVDHTNEQVPYMLGNHDTVALLGKVNNLERNVITLVIGENGNYKDILAANYDGSLGSGSGEDIHHQGYDYYAQQIYEQLVNYDNNQAADRWKKSYWIVGYGTGGSIANLVAKKFIDYKHVNTNVYCYTYQAPNTINRNNLTKRIANTKYQSIFNIENTDDIMLNLMGEDTGWTKYGVLKRLSVGDDKKIKQSWNKLTGDSYKGGTNFLLNLFDVLFDYFGGMVSGFSNTYISIDNLDYSELAKIIYVDRIKDAYYITRDVVLDYYRDEHEQLLIEATEVAKNGIIADLQASDLTTNDMIIINELATILQPMINVREIDVNMTVKKALDHMGKWYVENVYSYQGGGKTVNFINECAEAYASELAKEKWDEYKNKYKADKHVTSISSSAKILNTMDSGSEVAKYWCDKFERLGYKDKEIGDDCSRFAAAVYYHFFNRKLGITDGKGLNLKFGGSGSFVYNFNKEPKNIGYVLYHNGFEIWDVSTNNFYVKHNDFELQEGDLLYRHENGKNIHGKDREAAHLEFYIDENTSFGWGEIKNSYSENLNNKEFRIVRNAREFAEYFGDKPYKGSGIYNIKHREGEDEDLYSRGVGKDQTSRTIIERCDVGIPYTYVIRYTGVKR